MTIMTSMKSAGGTAAANMAAKVEKAAAQAKAKAEVAAAKAKAQAEANAIKVRAIAEEKARKKQAEIQAKVKAKLDKARAAATITLNKAKSQMATLSNFINKLESNIQSGDLNEYMSFGSPRRRKRTNKKKNSSATLKQLQVLARRNRVSIYKMRKDGRGYTKKPLTKKALKARLSRVRVSYKNINAPRSRIRPRKRYISRSPIRIKELNPGRRCPVGKYKDPSSGICKTIPKYEDLDELDSVNFDWSSDRQFSNRSLSKQMYGHSCFGGIPCDCGL